MLGLIHWNPPMAPRGILEAALYADDLEGAERFYTGVLRLEFISRQPGRHVFFRCGDSVLLVFDPRTTSRETTLVAGQVVPLHGSTGPGHVALRVHEAELPAWRDRLRHAGVTIEQEVAWPKGGHSIYFRDPAGNSVELATPALWGMPEH